MPLRSTGAGQVLPAFSGSAEQQACLDRAWRTGPEDVPIPAGELRQALAEVRRRGCATVVRARPGPLMSVAAPIQDGGGTVAAAPAVGSAPAMPGSGSFRRSGHVIQRHSGAAPPR
ncbi:IclR family transcriptional regulator C-terminal domain-containing protein [Streptomyces sp. V4-01]|uniref:IclR family transcriptional regulator C-terminal domain-containing protein n=1 Tax=Actinacidiphila polyblastidii TaxID=3110430 RepID=A0ABU7PGA9_9ACTN|nr:IclR family transcriptional regulator C-terminal domain-containing protein [Streptomyces sp. V4-01]